MSSVPDILREWTAPVAVTLVALAAGAAVLLAGRKPRKSEAPSPPAGVPPSATISGLFVYPVKGMGGHAVTTARLDATGLVWDRRFMVVDAGGRFHTQRQLPLMATLAAELVNPAGLEPDAVDSGAGRSLTLKLSLTRPLSTYGRRIEGDLSGGAADDSIEPEDLAAAAGGSASESKAATLDIPTSIEIPVLGGASHSGRREVNIWKSDVADAADQGDVAAEWLSAALGKPGLRLVFMDAHCSRPIKTKNYFPPEAGAGATPSLPPSFGVAFSDGFPLLVISEASLTDLNEKLAARGKAALPMNRFRPNVVVSGCPAWDEDEWRRFWVVAGQQGGEAVELLGTKRCSRCKVTTTDQVTGVQEGFFGEPLATLRTFRAGASGEVYVGMVSDCGKRK